MILQPDATTLPGSCHYQGLPATLHLDVPGYANLAAQDELPLLLLHSIHSHDTPAKKPPVQQRTLLTHWCGSKRRPDQQLLPTSSCTSNAVKLAACCDGPPRGPRHDRQQQLAAQHNGNSNYVSNRMPFKPRQQALKHTQPSLYSLSHNTLQTRQQTYVPNLHATKMPTGSPTTQTVQTATSIACPESADQHASSTPCCCPDMNTQYLK